MKIIPLTKGFEACVDDEDYYWLTQWKWQYHSGYATMTDHSGPKNKTIRMHRAVLDAPAGVNVDHINGNALDNRKENLRICTQVENTRNRALNINNTCGFKGVSWHKRIGKWQAQIQVSKKKKCIGYFDDLEQAARAYNTAAIALHGPFARLNDI